MTSMTMVGGLVAPAPQWRLGEMGQLLHDHLNTKIESLDQLTLYLQRNDADMLYGGRLLAQLDAILDDVRQNGISRDLAVAVESSRPGTIPANVRKVLTSNYTRTHQKETLVALESWREAGKLGLVILVVVAIMKMLSWILGSSSGYAGSGALSEKSADIPAFQEKAKETTQKVAAKLPPKEKTNFLGVAEGLKSGSVLAAYNAVYDKTSDKMKISRQLDVAALKLDAAMRRVEGSIMIDAISSLRKKSVFEDLFQGYVDGDKEVSPNSVIEDAVSVMLGTLHLGDAVFTNVGAKKITAFIPENIRKRGVRAPSENMFEVVNNRFMELNYYFGNLLAGFRRLRKLDMSNINDVNWNMHIVGPEMGEAIREMNEFMSTVIPDVSRSGVQVDTVPTMAMTEAQSRTMIGYGEPIEFLADKVLVVGGYESFLNSASFNIIRQEMSLSDSDSQSLLGAVCQMAVVKNISRNTRVTEMAGYQKLEKAVSVLINELEAFSKDAQRNRQGDAINVISRGVMKVIVEENPNSLNVGREMSMEYMDNPDFFAVLRKQLGYVRHVCRGVVGLNRIVSASAHNFLLSKG